jgi:hypothetical protein
MAIKIENGQAIIDDYDFVSKKDNKFFIGLYVFLLVFVNLNARFHPPLYIFLMNITLVFFILVFILMRKIPHPFLATTMTDFKMTVRLSDHKDIILKANWGISMDKEQVVKRGDQPFLEWKGFWRTQVLNLKTRKFSKTPGTIKWYNFNTSAKGMGFRFKKEEIEAFAKFLDVPVEGSLYK